MAKKQKQQRSTEADEEPMAGAPEEDGDEPEGTSVAEEASDGLSDSLREAAPLAELKEGDEGDAAATQLGTNRYVMAGFFVGGMLVAYVLGRALHGAWSNLSNKDWFSTTLPALAAVPDEDKSTYSTVIGAIVALFAVVRTYRRPDVREWTDEVASELTKVKWPTKKEVSNSTVIVIAASAIATAYLALLDRLWAFVTNLVYGTGT